MPPLNIFPEGLVTNGTALLKFKKGSFVYHTPLKLNVIKLNYNKFTIYNSEISNLFVLILLLMCNWYNTVAFY